MKGKFILSEAEAVANSLVILLKPACERILVAGSIRRRQPYVSDVELLAIPKFDGEDVLDRELRNMVLLGILALRLSKLGRRTYGPKNKLMVHVESGIGIDIFATTEECWPVALVVRTGGKQTNIRISMAAQKKGYQFHAYGSGFSTPNGEIVCRSEREVFETVGLPCLEPWERV